MRKLSSSLRLAIEERHRVFIFCVGIILLISSFASAQSGRRPPKKTESEGVQRPSEPETPIKPDATKQPEKERVPVLVVKASSYFSSYYMSDYVVEGCADRLRQAATLKVDKGNREMNRKEAGDAAKAPTERFVVLLEMTSERMGYDRRSTREEYVKDMVIQYTVFSPGTGKTKTSGRVYPRSRVGGVGLPVPGGPAAAEHLLKHAGRDVADRIIDSLVVVPSSRN